MPSRTTRKSTRPGASDRSMVDTVQPPGLPVSETDRRRRVRDVAPLMEAIEGIPVVTFPCPPIWLVFKCSQVQQSQYHLVDSIFVYFHEAPLCRDPKPNSERRTSMSSPTP